MSTWRPSAERSTLVLRASLAARIRAYFAGQGVLEVETPILSAAAPTDLHIHSISTQVTGYGLRYLQTSPEFPMKRLLAAGYGDCFQLARVFRDGDSGRQHSPEFTMLEWYREGWDDQRLMEEVDLLVRAVLHGHLALGPTQTIRYEDAMAQVKQDEREALHIPDGLAPEDIEDLVLGALVIPRLGHDGPCFLMDFPAEQAALARLRPGDSRWAARFELFINGVELANGYHELCNPDEQRTRFERDNHRRFARGLPEMPLDRDLLAALEHGMPECAGVALGFDRIVMLALGSDRLSDGLSFTP